jgi:signal transduction histidine kinase
MGSKLFNLLRKKDAGEPLLGEFGESLVLIVDPEQLTSNLLSKLRELANVEEALVYLADESDSPRFFHVVGRLRDESQLPDLVVKDKLVSWFRTNRLALFFDREEEVTRYLGEELDSFRRLSINAAFPLLSMDRLIGIVFLCLPEGQLTGDKLASIQMLSRQAGLAFENALLFKERLRQNERMFRAEQLATMGQFAAGIAHELRNPLTAIRSTIQYLAGEFEQDGERKKLASDVLDEVDRLNGIVENLLNLAKPTETNPQELDISKEVEHYLHFVEAQAKKQKVQIECKISEDLPKLFFDPAELRQVLINLVLNAMQAMPEGGPISIKASVFSARDELGVTARTKILIEVADKGVGIPPNLAEKVFEPFFTTKPGGTGLGLTICSNIVRRHGGEIWIEEGVGQGTVVKVTLPAA